MPCFHPIIGCIRTFSQAAGFAGATRSRSGCRRTGCTGRTALAHAAHLLDKRQHCRPHVRLERFPAFVKPLVQAQVAAFGPKQVSEGLGVSTLHVLHPVAAIRPLHMHRHTQPPGHTVLTLQPHPLIGGKMHPPHTPCSDLLCTLDAAQSLHPACSSP